MSGITPADARDPRVEPLAREAVRVLSNPHLRGAAASAGIENGVSTQEAIVDYLVIRLLAVVDGLDAALSIEGGREYAHEVFDARVEASIERGLLELGVPDGK